jgi:hypothetical protein
MPTQNLTFGHTQSRRQKRQEKSSKKVGCLFLMQRNRVRQMVDHQTKISPNKVFQESVCWYGQNLFIETIVVLPQPHGGKSVCRGSTPCKLISEQ